MATSAVLIEPPNDMGLKLFESFQSLRRSSELSEHQSSARPPPSFPDALHNTMSWMGRDFIDDQAYTYELQEKELVEIGNALKYFKELGLDGDCVGRHNFPLPKLQHRLALCSLELHKGKGFFVIRGLDPTRYSPEDNLILFLGISSYIGQQRGRQDSKGNMVSHIIDSKFSTVSQEKRHGIHSNKGLPYHNDMVCDILALHVRQCAVNGGSFMLASSWTVYNELALSRPDVIQTLCEPNWPIFTPGKKPSYTLCPVLSFCDGKIIVSLDPGRIGPHPSVNDGRVPVLTPEQNEALDIVLAIAHSRGLQIKSRPGDFQFINNLSLLHARQPFQDDNKSSRHLVRLWLRNENLGWQIPSSLKQPWEAAFGDGTPFEKKYPVVPIPVYKPPRFAGGSGSFMDSLSDSETDE